MSIQHHKNKLKTLHKLQKIQNPKKYVSVVYRNDDGLIEIPECHDPDCELSPGLLVIPKPMTEYDWARSNKAAKKTIENG